MLATLERERPEVCVVDSVQTLHCRELTSGAGSLAQVREVASRIMEVSKRLDIAALLVGHVTKDGALAGPRVLEHIVDCVLQFEGERERTYRTVRAVKNRFGSTDEAGVFEMRDHGLVEVLDASARFVGEATRAPGSVVLCAMEGSRPLLVEVQALVSPSELVSSPKPPAPDAIYYAQASLWAKADICRAIAEVNKGSLSVKTSPVKRLLSITIPFAWATDRTECCTPSKSFGTCVTMCLRVASFGTPLTLIVTVSCPSPRAK